MVDVLLDTTFLLPTLGVDVQEIKSRDFEVLTSLSGIVKFHCSYVSLVEILGKLARILGRDMASVELGIRSLLEPGTCRWINPSSEALKLAVELRLKGHKDNIDNILYSIARESRMVLLLLDEEFKRFLLKNGYDIKTVMSVKGLQVACW